MKPDDIRIDTGIYRFSWNGSLGICVRIDRLRDHRGRLEAEITVWSSIFDTRIYHSQINLLTNRSRKEVAITCRNRPSTKNDINWQDFPWEDAIEEVCLLTLEDYRKVKPPVKIGNNPITKPKHLLYPMLVENQANLIFGPGESAKSLFTVFVALLVQSGTERCGLHPLRQVNALYLDYETDQEELNHRSAYLKKGMGFPEDLDILYKDCSQPLVQEIDQISQMIVDHNIGLVVVDSFTMACGGDSLLAEPVTNYYRALRALNATTLTVDHVTKEGSRGPYGSIFKFNEARNIFQIKSAKEEEEDRVEIVLIHTKFNNGRRVKPYGYKFSFFEDGTIVESTDVTENAALSAGLPLQYQIIELLKHGGMNVKSIASELGAEQDTVRRTLNRYRNKRFVSLMDGQWGIKAHET